MSAPNSGGSVRDSGSPFEFILFGPDNGCSLESTVDFWSEFNGI
jgi:hypothetical protein